MSGKEKLRQCDHCGKEFKPRVESQRFCHKQCRWDYNNALKLESAPKQVNGVYTPLHVSETTEKPKVVRVAQPIEIKPEKTQPDVSQSDVVTELRSMIKLLKKQIDIYEQQITIQQQMLDYFLSSGVGVVQADRTPNNFGINPPVPIDTDDELPIVEVKQSTKQGQSSQNFLNSLLALG